MYIYDGESPVFWANRGLLSRDDMMEVPEFGQLLSEPSVLFDDGAGKVYGWKLLDVLAGEWGVERTDDPDADLASIVEAMQGPAKESIPEAVKRIDGETTAIMQAVGELGVMSADLKSENADIMQAIGELGTLVASASAK